jgi:hypothetical protein
VEPSRAEPGDPRLLHYGRVECRFPLLITPGETHDSLSRQVEVIASALSDAWIDACIDDIVVGLNFRGSADAERDELK